MSLTFVDNIVQYYHRYVKSNFKCVAIAVSLLSIIGYFLVSHEQLPLFSKGKPNVFLSLCFILVH